MKSIVNKLLRASLTRIPFSTEELSYNALMKRKHLALFTAISFLLFFSFEAIGNDIRFERISILKGSMRSVINDISQDSQGFLWLATRRGLYKYDGLTFTHFRHNPLVSTSIISNIVDRILMAEKDVLWLSTDAGGVERFNLQTEEFRHFELIDEKSSIRKSESALQMIVDEQNNLWILSSAGSLFRSSEQKDRFEHVDIGESDSLRQVGSILTTGSGKPAFLVIDEGYFSFNNGAQAFSPVPESELPHLKHPFWNDATDRESWRERMWMKAFANQLSSSDSAIENVITAIRNLERSLPDDTTFVNKVVTDSAGRVWAATDDAGLFLYNPENRQVRSFKTGPAGLNSNAILSLYLDDTETIWIGTPEGLNKFSRFRFKFEFMDLKSPEGEKLGNILAVCEDSNANLWVSTLLDGLYRYSFDGDNMAITRLSDEIVLSILQDSDGTVYIGTANSGLLRFDPRSENFTRVVQTSQVTDIHEDRSGKLWLATLVDGIGELNRQTNEISFWEPPAISAGTEWSFEARVIYEDSENNIWFGSDGGGLIKLFPDGTTFVRYTHDDNNVNSLSSDQIMSICGDRNGMIWVGTQNGLNKIDQKVGLITRYYEGNLLPDNVICSILDDDEGNLWISTFSGLVKFIPDSTTAFQYGVNDGLQDYVYTAGAFFKNSEGKLYFGGINGVDSFVPSELDSNPHQPSIVITRFEKIRNDDVTPILGYMDESVTLSHEENSVFVEYAALDFNDAGRNRYQHMLEGLDADWIDNGNARFARYSGIPPGTYTLRIKASNNDGVWNENGIAVNVVIVPPFWTTWQFRVMAMLLAIALVVGIYRLRVNAVEKHRIELLKEVEERKIAEMKLLTHQTRLRSMASELTLSEERQRRRIATSLHDDIGHALLGTKVKLSTLENKLDQTEDKNSIRNVLETIEDTLKHTRSLTTDLSPPSLYQFGFESAAENLVEKFGEEYDIRSVFTLVKSGHISEETAVLLYQSLRELLINILKHAQAKTITVVIDMEDELFSVAIKDDGVGFDTSSILDEDIGSMGYGLFSIRERLESVGGKFRIFSEIGKGTEMKMFVPVAEVQEE